MLEAKVEYLLDEVYNAKAQLRLLRPFSQQLADLQEYQLKTFDLQWLEPPYHDQFLTNPAWRNEATADVCQRLEVDSEWLRGEKVLDCRCGLGRFASSEPR
jgi:hypothetical protein